MRSELPTATAEPEVRDTWREIEDVVQSVAQLSRTPVSAERFFGTLMQGSLQVLAAVAGAVWLRRTQPLELEYQVNLGAVGIVASKESADSPELQDRFRRHHQLIEQVAEEPTPRSFPPQAAASDSGTTSSENPTEHLLLLVPIAVDSTVLGVIEVFQRANVSPAACQGFLRFLGALADLAADYLRNSRLRDLQDRASLWSQFERFSERVHQGLDVTRIAAVIVNDGRQVANCDRVSLALLRGSKARLIAVTGVDRIDRRAQTTRAIETLIQRVMATGQAFWFDDAQPVATSDVRGIAPPIEQALHEHLDESHARLLAVLPLREATPLSASEKAASPRMLGAILIERFSAAADVPQLRQRAEVLARQCQLALSNALDHSNLPFVSVLRLASRIGWYLRLRQLPKTALIVGLLVSAVAALVFVPADFTIEGRGELQPALRRGIFASSDGVVMNLSEKLASNQTATVDADEVLIELSNAALDFEQTRLTGELQTTQQKQSTTQVERLNMDRNDPRGRGRLEQLAAEERELEATKQSLIAQLDVLKRQQADLKLRSSISGQVLTWDVAQLLTNRPVRQGDQLLEVADVKGDWILEVYVADQNISFVREARKSRGEDLSVDFVLATDPSVVYHGRVKSVALDARTDGELQAAVLVRVSVPRETVPTELLRPGATVIPHIHCGQRAIGFVWFHELLHTIQTRLFF